MGFSVDAHIGDSIKPMPGRRMDGGKVRDIETGKEVFFNIACAIFPPAFFVSGADITGGNGKAIVVGKIKIPGIKYRGLSDNTFEHGRLKIINHDLFRNSPEKVKSVLMTSQKMFHSLRYGELHIHQTAVTQRGKTKISASLGGIGGLPKISNNLNLFAA